MSAFNSSATPFQLLGRATYGPTQTELAYVQKNGWEKWVAYQLAAPEKEVEMEQRLANATLPIRFRRIKGENAFGEPIEGEEETAVRKLEYLNATPAQLYDLIAENRKVKLSFEEKHRPANEVRAATMLRQRYSEYQLLEVMTEFWHNHFNVQADANLNIGAFFPLHDRAIRDNVFGNFRTLLEAIAQSPAMLYYLNNNESKSGPANENYARELFELHTLGAGAYLNAVYNKWKQVPGAFEEKPIGYIDQDVYEAARAFTGWTVGDGARLGHQERLPETGDFFYYEAWHDNYQKRVLGVEIEANQPPLADGKKVLDLVAYHPATAKHVCEKLCQRFIGDTYPESLVTTLSEIWIKNQTDPDQIKKVLYALLYSLDFCSAPAQKIKTPPELIMSFLRGIGADLTPHQSIYYTVIQMGYKPFGWPAPTGHPDTNSYWISSNMLLNRWNAIIGLLYNKEAISYNLEKHFKTKGKTADEVQKECYIALCGTEPSEKIVAQMATIKGGREEVSPDFIRKTVGLIGLLPEFQYR
jgi:uncharacterized protein (DUF1800 family)